MQVMRELRDEKLDFWIKNNLNALFIGHYGSGKTTRILEAFKRNKLNFKYFSAATMDPWCDFIGVPKVMNDDKGAFLDYVLPRDLRDDTIEAIYMDEFNRCLSGDTLIQLADGHSVKIKDLVGKSSFYVYSYDLKENKIVIAKGHSARITGRKESLVKITLDNGKSVKTTNDHPFLTRNGEYVKAIDLKIGDSLMPIYKNNNHKIVKIESTDSEDVYDISVEEYHNFALDIGIFVHNSHKKVRNAVMELLQFKSINGRPFKNLRLIWAAINPDEEGDYQVEALDKAQKDRFQVQISIPYEPNLEYFASKFNIKQAKVAVNWWGSLSPELQMEVSPRRLEYALQMFNIPGGNIRDVLPNGSNPSKLSSLLKSGPIDDRMKEMLANKDADAANKFFKVENNYASAVSHIIKEIPVDEDQNAWKLFFLQAIPMEKLSVMMSSDEDAYNFIIANCDKAPNFQRSISDILSVNMDKILVRRIKKELDNNPALSSLFNTAAPSLIEKPYYSTRLPASVSWTSKLAGWLIQPMDVTPERIKIYDEVVEWIPKSLNLNDAVGTLELINMLVSRSQAATLKQFKHLVGVVNHCIDQIHKASGLCWSEILTNYGQKMDKLLSKMKDMNMHLGLLHPAKKVS